MPMPYADAIASIESGGNYSILGPETKGDRAYGKYQIMGNNIGPWSKEILGQEVTPQQFLENPQIQDAIFQGKFGQYVEKYGPEGAAKAWFAGEKGMNNPNAKDVLGTSVAGYGSKFMKALRGQPSAAQTAPASPLAPATGIPSQPLALAPEPSQPPLQVQQPQGLAPDAPMQVPDTAMQAPPIFAPPRKPPDLRALRAALARPPAGLFFGRA